MEAVLKADEDRQIRAKKKVEEEREQRNAAIKVQSLQRSRIEQKKFQEHKAAKAKAAAAAAAKAEAEAKAKADAEAKAKAEAEAKAKAAAEENQSGVLGAPPPVL